MSEKSKRGAVKKATSTLIAVWLPQDLAAALDQVVKADDSDRSKTIRKAIRRHIAAHGL